MKFLFVFASLLITAVYALRIHPNGNEAECVTIEGTSMNGTPVIIFTYNQFNDSWHWNETTAAWIFVDFDNSVWCLDAGDISQWADGVKMKIWECFPKLPQQIWTNVADQPGQISLPGGTFCLDLTNGNTTNHNQLQIWTCGAGNPNQLWTATSS